MTLAHDTSVMAERFFNGESMRSIAQDLGCSEGTVRYRLKRAFGARIRCHAKLTEETATLAKRMLADGIEPMVVALRIGCTPQTIRKLRQRVRHHAVLVGLRDKLVAIRNNGKIKDTTEIDAQIDALNAILL